ncbi:MAG: nitrilase [Deltaproteobacteria bacterium]|nr:nitrilase [Deltaproteobacteria bacterium]
MRDVRIAAVCMHSETSDIDGNLAKTKAFVDEAVEMDVDIICFPELSLSGYSLDDPERSSDDFSFELAVERVVEIARKRGLLIIAGIAEPCQGRKPFITQIVAGPSGLLGSYRKTHLSPKEKEKYSAGDSIQVFSYEKVNFGISLCYEAHFPEIYTVMALKGAEIIFIPHASPRGSPMEKNQSWLRHLPCRAFDNGTFVAACNQVGKTREGYNFPGVVMIFDPLGRLLGSYRGNHEKMIVAELREKDLISVRRHSMSYFMPHRRPRLYRDLCKG